MWWLTLFDVIFEQFLLTIDDRRFVDNLTPDILASTLSKYLDRARSIFGDYCYKNLNNYISTQSESYNFVGDGIVTNFVLPSTPPSDCEFYISLNDDETENYSFDVNTNTMTISPAVTGNIYIGAYKTGYFIDDLNIQEITILARAMQIPWTEFMLLKKKHLDQIVYGKNMQVHSQANHTKENRDTLRLLKDNVMQDIFYYTYKQNDDTLNGINGGKLL